MGFYGSECRAVAELPSSGHGGWFFEVEAPTVDAGITIRMPHAGNVFVVSYRGNFNVTSINMSFDNYVMYDYYEFGPEQWALWAGDLEHMVKHADRAYLDQKFKRVVDEIIKVRRVLHRFK